MVVDFGERVKMAVVNTYFRMEEDGVMFKSGDMQKVHMKEINCRECSWAESNGSM